MCSMLTSYQGCWTYYQLYNENNSCCLTMRLKLVQDIHLRVQWPSLSISSTSWILQKYVYFNLSSMLVHVDDVTKINA